MILIKSPFFFLLITSFISNAQLYNIEIEAKVEVISNGEFYEITGTSLNKTEINRSLRYVFSVFKANLKNNNSNKNSQEGRFILQPNQKKSLSTTTLNIGDKDRIIILLLIYDDEDNILGKDRVVLNEYEKENPLNNSKKKVVEISEDASYDGADGVMIRGLVIENTKTKPGRDFFREYTDKYRNSGINGIKIITVNEILAVGSNTKIQLQVGDDVIVQFFVNPRSDYISQMVDYSIQKTHSYFNKLRKNWDVKKKY